jgi:membrane-associated phospholipid phosphatase
VIQGALLVAVTMAGWWRHVSIDRGTIAALALVPALLFLLWAYFVWEPGRTERDWILAEFLLCLGLLLSCSMIASGGQYTLGSLGAPNIEQTLIAIDRWFGLDVSVLAAWTRRHKGIPEALVWAYNTLTPQFLLTVGVLGLLRRDRQCLWQFMVLFHITLCATLAIFAVAAAAPPQDALHFQPVIDQSSVTHDYSAVRAGVLHTIPVGVSGLIAFPSFHAAGGLVVAWSVRRTPLLRALLWPLNALLVLSTVMSGVHYASDVFASIVLVMTSIGTCRRFRIDAWHEPVSSSPA